MVTSYHVSVLLLKTNYLRSSQACKLRKDEKGMRKRSFTAILAAVCIAFSTVQIPIQAQADEELLPSVGTDLGGSLRRRSFMYPTEDGFVRVFMNDLTTKAEEKSFCVETYTDDLELISKKSIELELPIWGGLYAGKDGYYVVEGRNNEEEDNGKEVIRVIRYNSDWERAGAASITSESFFGGQVRYPFDYGNVEMTEKNGKLYIVTGHEGYVDEQYGQGHQGFLMITVDEAEMTGNITDCDLWHSFAQLIDSDSKGIYVLEQSEGSRYTQLSEVTSGGERSTSIPTLEYGGKHTSAWSIPCRATVESLTLSESSVLALGASIDQTQYDNYDSSTPYNLYLTVTPRDSFTQKDTQILWLTNYTDSTRFTDSEITKVGEDRYIVTWEEPMQSATKQTDLSDPLSAHTLHYLFVDGKGKKIGKEMTASAAISSCKPVVKNKRLVYCASDFGTIDIYSIDTETGELQKKCFATAGEHITWKYKDGVLTFSGNGAMTKASAYSWAKLSDNVTKLVIGDGITSVSDGAFEDLSKLEEAEIADSVTSIGNKAFANCDSLTEVRIPQNVTSVGSEAFAYCQNLEKVYFPESVIEIGKDVMFSGWYRTSTDHRFTDDLKITDAYIYTTKGSYADEYAEANRIQIEYVNEETATTEATTTAATVPNTTADNTTEHSDVVIGDVDLNGMVELADITKLAKYILNPSVYPLGDDNKDSVEKAKTASDLNTDGVINAIDLSRLIEFNLGN